MDLIPRGERRRRWTIEQKQTIAAQSLAPGASPTNIARLHGSVRVNFILGGMP
jgi:transposase-like protein